MKLQLLGAGAQRSVVTLGKQEETQQTWRFDQKHCTTGRISLHLGKKKKEEEEECEPVQSTSPVNHDRRKQTAVIVAIIDLE